MSCAPKTKPAPDFLMTERIRLALRNWDGEPMSARIIALQVLGTMPTKAQLASISSALARLAIQREATKQGSYPTLWSAAPGLREPSAGVELPDDPDPKPALQWVSSGTTAKTIAALRELGPSSLVQIVAHICGEGASDAMHSRISNALCRMRMGGVAVNDGRRPARWRLTEHAS